MREIKFRGKTLFDGRRIEGDLQHDGELILIVDATHRETVKPESVEQLIAIDKNGREVYENDMVKWVFFEDKGRHCAALLDIERILEGDVIYASD